MHPTQLSKAVPQIPDGPIDGDIHTKHLVLPVGAPVDHGDIHRSSLSLGQGQRDADVGIKSAGLSSTGGTEEGGAELALEETLDETIVAFQVASECFGCYFFIRTACGVLHGGGGGGDSFLLFSCLNALNRVP